MSLALVYIINMAVMYTQAFDVFFYTKVYIYIYIYIVFYLHRLRACMCTYRYIYIYIYICTHVMPVMKVCKFPYGLAGQDAGFSPSDLAESLLVCRMHKFVSGGLHLISFVG